MDGRGGEYPDIPSKFFCLITVSKKFVGETFTVALISGTERVWRRGGGEYQDFPSKFFCLTVPQISVEESFTAALISRIEKVWIRGVVSKISVEKSLSHSAEKSVRESFTVALVSGIEKVWISGGGKIKIFRRKMFLSHCAIFRRGILYCCSNFR